MIRPEGRELQQNVSVKTVKLTEGKAKHKHNEDAMEALKKLLIVSVL